MRRLPSSIRSALGLGWRAVVVWFGTVVLEAAEPLRVAAASSLTGALKEINAAFTVETGRGVVLNLGASNVLARQIVEGAPADVFVSADSAKMDELEAKGVVETGTREDQLSNTLVVVVPVDSKLRLTDIKDLAGEAVDRVVTGDPKAVPVGVYARQFLTGRGLWDRISPKVVAVESVRAALAAVESGNIEAGIVYRTDAVFSKKVRVALEVSAAAGPPIRYPMAVVKEAADPALARRYLEFLDSEASKVVFEKFGFIVLPEADGDR